MEGHAYHLLTARRLELEDITIPLLIFQRQRELTAEEAMELTTNQEKLASIEKQMADIRDPPFGSFLPTLDIDYLTNVLRTGKTACTSSLEAWSRLWRSWGSSSMEASGASSFKSALKPLTATSSLSPSSVHSSATSLMDSRSSLPGSGVRSRGSRHGDLNEGEPV